MNQYRLTFLIVFIIAGLGIAALAYAEDDRMAGPNPVSSGAQEDAPTKPIRYRDVDDRMGGSLKAKAAMRKDGPSEDEKKPVASKKAERTESSEKPVSTAKKQPPQPEKKPANSADDKQQDHEDIATGDESSSGKDQDKDKKESSGKEDAADETDAAEKSDGKKSNDEYVVARSEKPARVPAVLKVNYSNLESLGTLSGSSDGSLGIDLWDGSSRGQVLQLINQIPSPRYYGVLQELNQRALLTRADATMMGSRGSIQAGEDLQTVRIEKLLDTGSYLQASQLYMADQAVAYHERLARAGVQSLFLSRQPTIACLETKTMMVRFEDQPFWNQASIICDFILGKMAGQVMKDFNDRPDVKPVIKESRVLGYVFDKPSYKITPREFEDLNDYTPLEIALLLNDRRISLSKFDTANIRSAPSHTLGVLMMVPEADGALKISLWSEALRRGMITPDELGSFYQNIKLQSKDLRQAKGWLVLPAYYQAIGAARDKDQKKKLAHEVLRFADQFEEGAFAPFAGYISTLSAEGMSDELVQRITRAGLLAGAPVSRSLEKRLWQQAESGEQKQRALVLALSNAALQNFSTEEMPKGAVFQELTGKLPETSKTLIFAVIEKLDISGKLHNSDANKVYEKPDGLTSTVDYVMPSSGLMENLGTALKEKRLGEVILLSSIAIGDIPPSKLDPAVLAEVIDGLKTVGLTSEARELASEAVLGLLK